MKNSNKKINYKKNNHSFLLRRNIITLSTSFALMIVALIATILVLNPNKNEKKFMAYDGYYNSNQQTIDSSSRNDEYIKFSTMYTGSSTAKTPSSVTPSEGQFITIETADELYAFSKLCNLSNNSYKTYKYKLLNNINWKDKSYTASFDPIETFSGEFDGNGYTIKNMDITGFTTGTLEKNYAMFREVESTGYVHDFGLIDPILSINFSTVPNPVYISNICAINNGTIDYVFVRDGHDLPQKQNLGISIAQGNNNIYVSGVVGVNNNKFTNSYYVSKRLMEKDITVAEFQEILYSNESTQTNSISNLYFYDERISSFTSGSTTEIKYTGINRTYRYTTYYGQYSSSLDDLRVDVTEASGTNWVDQVSYPETTFGKYGSFFNFITPLTLKFNNTVSYNSTTNKYTVEITNVDEFNMIYNLMNINDKFSSEDFIYVLKTNVNLNDIAVPTYSDSIDATFTSDSTTRTIYLSKYNYSVTADNYQAFGVFPYLTGTVSNLNIVVDDPTATNNILNFNTSSNKIVALGAVAGYTEEAVIDNVNVYINISFKNNIGKYFVGGLVGVSDSDSEITNSTVTGSIENAHNTSDTNFSEVTGVINGIAIGGCIGYVGRQGATVNTLLSEVQISTQGYTSKDVMIGGVVGAGYFKEIDNLQNRGNISIGKSNASVTGSTIWAAGVIGRLLGMSDQASFITNNGDVTLYQTSGTSTYLAGIINADIQTSETGEYALKNKGKFVFWAAAATNGADIKLINSNTGTYMYSYCFNINNKTTNDSVSFTTKLSGVYNLNYRFNDENTPLGAIEINMNTFKEFAPIISASNTTNSSYSISLTTVYNLRDIEYSTNANITSATTFNYASITLAKYVDYVNVRNEGNQTFTLKNGISTASTLKASGLFDTLYNGFTAKSLYNGGNILIVEPNNSTSEKKLDLQLSGICNLNESVDEDQKQNPLSTNYDNSLVGTMNNVINAGDIKLNLERLDKTTTINNTPTNKPYLNSNIYVGGITYTNKGIISNAFNLGDIDISIYSYAANKHYEAGGITYLMDGEYAQIRDSANNGDIYVIDTLVKSSKSYINVGGIVARNTTNVNNNNKQVISFTINYGTIMAFQSADNTMTPTSVSTGNCHSSAGGILGQGICNIVDILNYGNIYGNECVAGIVSLVKLDAFNNNNVKLANTINYGQIKINPQYYATTTSNQNYQSYNTIIGLEYLENSEVTYKKTHAGAITSIFDFSNRNNVEIRFLINLYSDATTVLYSLNTPNAQNAPDISTFITSHGTTDSFGGNSGYIKYAPLSSIDDTINGNIGAFSTNFVFYKAIKGEGLDPEHYITDLYISDFFEFVLFDKVNPKLLDKIGWRTIAYQKAAEALFKNVSALAALVNESEAEDLLSDAFTSDTWLSSIDTDILNSLINESMSSGELNSSYSAILEYILLDENATSSYTNTIRNQVVTKILEYYENQGNNDYYKILQSMLYDVLLAKTISSDDTNYENILSFIRTTLATSDLSTVFDDYIALLRNNNNTILDPLFEGNTKNYYEDPKINLIQTLLNGYDEYTLQALYEKLTNSSSDTDAIQYKLYLQNHTNIAKNIYIGMITYNSLKNNSNYLNWVNSEISKYNFDALLTSEEATDATFSKMIDTFGNISDLQGYKYTPFTGVEDSKENIYTTEASTKTIQNFVANSAATSLNVPVTKDYSALWNIIKNSPEVLNYIQQNYFTASYRNPTTGNNTTNGFLALATEYNNTYQSNDRSQLSYNIPISTKNGFGLSDKADRTYYDNNEHTVNSAVNTRFIYTPDDVVSYRTNYFGPYMAATGTNAGKAYDADGKLTANNLNYNIGMVLNVVDASQTAETKRYIVPVFISVNEDITKNAIATSGTTTTNTHTYPFYWNNCNYSNGNLATAAHQDFMWKDLTFVSQIPTNATGFLYYLTDNDGKILNDKENYILDGYNFAPNYVPTIQTDYDSTRPFFDHGMNKPGTNTHNHTDKYLIGYATAAMITGIWYTYSCYNDHGYHISLHCKDENKNYAFDTPNYCGIHTTSYIGYTINDLVALDGIKTKGKCNGELDEDEINIVSAICTKLLSDNKELVLRAIANYANDNSFTTSNADALNMLISSVQDTEFATESIVSGISSLLDLYYNNTNTIRQYLASLDTAPTNIKDKIIVAATNNKTNFRTLLLETLTNYSLKSKLYENYYDYTRSAVTEYIYKYISYKYNQDNNLNWNDFDTLLSEISDQDLENIEDLFDIVLDYYVIDSLNFTDDATNTIFTINDATYYSSNNDEYDNAVLIGNTNYDGTTGSNIAFATGNYEHGYDLLLTFNGTVYLDSLSNPLTSSDNYGEFLNISNNSNHVLYFNEGTEIYDIQLVNSEYTSPTYTLPTATSPFATITSREKISGNIDLQEQTGVSKQTLYGVYYRMYTNNGNQKEGTDRMNIAITQSNISYNSLKITFMIAARQGYQALDITNQFNNQNITFDVTNLGTVTINEQSADRTYYVWKYETTLDANQLNVSSNNSFYIQIHFKVPNDFKTSALLSSVCFDYDYNFTNGTNGNITNVIFHQDLFSPYYDNSKNNNIKTTGSINVSEFKNIYRSTLSISNNNDLCSVDINAGEITDSINFPEQNYITQSINPTLRISSAPVFTPKYENQSYEQGDVLDAGFNVNNLVINKTLADNLNLGYYNDLSDVGKFIIKDYFTKQTGADINTNGKESYIEFYATGNGTISLYYEGELEEPTINVSTETNEYQWFEFIGSGIYTYTASSGVTIDSVYVAPVGEVITYTTNGNTDKLTYFYDDKLSTILEFDYSTISTMDLSNQYISAFNTAFETSYEKYQLFYTIYPYYRNVTGKTNLQLYNNDVFETIITLMGTIKQDTNKPNYFTIFAQPEFTNEKLIQLIKLIALADYKGTDSALGKLIAGLNSDYYDDLITYCCSTTEIRTNVVKKIYNIAKSINDDNTSGEYSKLELLIYGAFLGDNYVKNPNYLESTYMYTLLNDFNPDWTSKAGAHYGLGGFQFITSNSSVDSDIVSVLIEYLQGSSDIELGGYGIYALASSQGKKQGKFIPDNLALDDMDPYYKVDSYVGYKLVGFTINNGVIEASSDATWRGGTSTNEDATPEDSVNDAFYNDMKQLLKSISTTIFDLTLTLNGTNYYGDIDLDSGDITYYVTDNDSAYGRFTVSNIDLAYAAECYEGVVYSYENRDTSFGINSQFNANIDTVKDITVFAEDRSVKKQYHIKFKILKASFDLLYSNGEDSMEVNSSTSNTTITLNLTSASQNPNPSDYTAYLPVGLDLKPYIEITNIDTNEKYSFKTSSPYVDISTRSGDHIVKAIKTNGTVTGSQSTITLIMSYKLPAGTYHISVSVCGYTSYVTYVKNASSNCEITRMVFNGSPITIANNMTNTIPFGRLYNNIELTDYEEKYYSNYEYQFYLDEFEYSTNADVTVSVVRNNIDVIYNSTVLYTKYQYVITYVVKAEDYDVNNPNTNSHIRTYTHTLTELDPYSYGDKYATVSKDGEIVNAYEATNDLYDQNDTLTNDNVISLKYDYRDYETMARVKYNRSDADSGLNEPSYRIKYETTNIYTLNTDVTFTRTDITENDTIKNLASIKTVYRGMNITIPGGADTGDYQFLLTYKNTGYWNITDNGSGVLTTGEAYYSEYKFPVLQITKVFSTDSTLKSITFIDAYSTQSAASTGVTVNVMRPVNDSTVGQNEFYYGDILDNDSMRQIGVESNGEINYGHTGVDYSTTSYYDYYIVGSVANAQLKNYSPTFDIEEHAMMFQYVTEEIRTKYGAGKQEDRDGNVLYSDKEILEKHDSKTYLYIPFKKGTDNYVFLVELNGKQLTNIYDLDYNQIGTINLSINSAAHTEFSFESSADNQTYSLDRTAYGKPIDNPSLYMNYIGTPIKDHFWYVNYVIFSENYIKSTNNYTYVKYYHISIIDRSNNVYFELKVIVPNTFDVTKFNSLYLQIEGYYPVQNEVQLLTLGAYVTNPVDYGADKKIYTLRYDIQMLPSAYYYFYIDLPAGYEAEATITNGKTNTLGIEDYLGLNNDKINYEGAYLPPSSIVAQMVELTLNVTEGATGETNVWGITTSDVYTRNITLDDDNIVGN